MQTEYLLRATYDCIEKENGFHPFSNGTEAMSWCSRNCDSCIKAITTRVQGYSYPSQADDVILSGRECVGNYAIGAAHFTGQLPAEIVEWMMGKTRVQKNGYKIADLPSDCPWFSDDKADNPDLQPIEPDDPNQLLIPFDITDLFGFDDPDIAVTKTAILEINY